MAKSLINPMLATGIVVIIAVTWMIGGNTEEPNYEFLPGMLYSIPYDSFAANEHFPDGKTMQTPIPGTIARGHMPLYYAATPEDALRAGEELQNPFAADAPPTGDEQQNTFAADRADALLRGARVYLTFCLPCHGPTGKGDGLVTQRGFPPPPTFFRDETRNMKDGQLFHILTYGQGNMPSYAAQVTPEDRWKTIAYIRSLQEKDAAAAQAKDNE